MSFDIQLGFIFFACPGGLNLAGRFLTLYAQLIIAALLTLVAGLLSLERDGSGTGFARRPEW